MRVSRFTQFATFSVGLAIVFGSFIGLAFHAGKPSTSLPEAISQEFEERRDRNVISQRRRPGQLLRSLNLSSNQKAQLFDIQTQYKDEIRENRQILRNEIAKLRQLMSSDVSSAEVSAQFSQVQSSRQTLNEIKFKRYLSLREILTVEQHRIFSNEMQTRQNRVTPRRNIQVR